MLTFITDTTLCFSVEPESSVRDTSVLSLEQERDRCWVGGGQRARGPETSHRLPSSKVLASGRHGRQEKWWESPGPQEPAAKRTTRDETRRVITRVDAHYCPNPASPSLYYTPDPCEGQHCRLFSAYTSAYAFLFFFSFLNRNSSFYF